MTRRSRLHPLLPLLALLIFWANGVAHLDVWPLVHEDEPWILSPGYTLWTEGRFGSDLFTGFYGMERHFFGFMPLFSILNGGLARLVGVGLFQARLGSLSLMLLALAATYALGRALFSPAVGLVAVLFLTFFRVAGPFFHLRLGIPFADAARIARYDMAVPVFGLLALLSFIKGVRAEGTSARWFGLSGALAGLAALCHVYGAFWLPGLALAQLWLAGRRSWTGKTLKPIGLMAAGFALVWLPYLAYVAAAWPDFLGQNLVNRQRADLANPAFYLVNLLQEVERYDPLLNGAKAHLGAWLLLIGLPLSALWLLRRAIRRADPAAKILLAPAAALSLGLAILISPKTFTYLSTLWPLLAITLAAGLVRLWRVAAPPRWWRPALALVFLLALAEGGWGMVRFQQQAAQTTPYRQFTARLAQHLPAEGRVLALQHYWLGLPGIDYRTFLVPAFLASPRHVPAPISFYQGLARSQPQVIVVDEVMQRYFDELAPGDHPDHQKLLDFQRYLADHRARISAAFTDPTYGRVTIYQLEGTAP